eukprot:m.191224 g.191224  ORF g.191224 m.191224 type:complete len:516 (+) comp10592_c1_seq1:4188-5735(+)
MEQLNAKPIKGRKIAIDWALAKSEYEQLAAGAAPATTEDTEQASDSADSESESDGSDSDSDASDSDESDSDDDDDGKKKNKKKKAKDSKEQPPQKPSDVGEGKTLFIRNVSFDVSEDDVKKLFSQYGNVVVCKIVKDKETGHSRGTAFVKYSDQESAQKCLKAASDKLAGNIWLDQRQLHVSLAVNRDEASKLKNNTTKEKGKVDRRNLYLAREGIILEDSPAFATLPKSVRQKRQNLVAEGNAKAANPNYFVSKTRLTVHNLPLTVDDMALKNLFRKAAEASDEGVGKIKQAKIVRSKDRVDSSGKGRSRGFGFVEFEDHDAALRALRQLNNNPECFGDERRPIVMFAWENAQVIKARSDRMQRLQQRTTQLKAKDESRKKRKIDVSMSIEGAKEPGSKSSGGAKKDGPKAGGIKGNQAKRKTEKNPLPKGSLAGPAANKRRRMNESATAPADKGPKDQKKPAPKPVQAKEKKPKRKSAPMTKDDMKFDALVNKYKKKLASANQIDSSVRWFQQ